MSNKPGFYGSSPIHQGGISVPPRTLLSELDDSGPVVFDSQEQLFTPTSPGKHSPGRPKTMKEYEEDIVNLKKENFNLKVRMFFMEQNHLDPNLPKDINELRNYYTDLKIDYELQKKDLASKEDLLLKSYSALDAQKQQLETMKIDYEVQRQVLQDRVESLEKDLKEYHLKFMETSVQLDDTNAIYKVTFGINDEPGFKQKSSENEKKVKELQTALASEKKQMLELEDMIAELNEKSSQDQKSLQHLQVQVVGMEEKLTKALKEKHVYEESVKQVSYQTFQLEKDVQRRNQTIMEKEKEIESMKILLKGMTEELDLLKCRSKEKQETSVQTDSDQFELQKHINRLIVQNTQLKQELENINSSRPLKECSSGGKISEKENEQAHQLKESQLKIEELVKEIEDLKNNKPSYLRGGVETIIQTLCKENKVLKKELEELKISKHKNSSANHTDSTREEALAEVISHKDCLLKDNKSKLIFESIYSNSELTKTDYNMKKVGNSSIKDSQEQEVLSKELEEKRKEVEILKKELTKRTYNLQGLVNTELWDKNREIEKLNKVCERRDLEVLALQKQLREYQSSSVRDNVTSFVSPITLKSSFFVEDKENMYPFPDHIVQLQHLSEENRQLVIKVKELQAQLLNTPERDTESLLVQNLRTERDQAEKICKEAVNACMLLTTRLQELADFLESLLPSLYGKKRKVVQQAVERSRELSKSLSLAAEESTLLHCSAWTDLQPSLYVPLLPDISTVDFWSGEESQEEDFSCDEINHIKSKEENCSKNIKQKEKGKTELQPETIDNSLTMKSVFKSREENVIQAYSASRNSLHEIGDYNIEQTLDDVHSLHLDNTQHIKLSPEVKSANIGKITLSSKKKNLDVSSTVTFEECSRRQKCKDECASEYETWSEPDRDVSYARIGLNEAQTKLNTPVQNVFGDTSENDNSSTKFPSSKKGGELQRLQRKICSLEQMNEALRNELMILHQLAPPVSSREDKATSIECSSQSLLYVPSRLLEEIRIQREKLEASLFHNDYIRRQLENTVSSLQKFQIQDEESAIFLKFKDVTNHLEIAERKLTQLEVEKETLNKEIDNLKTKLDQKSTDVLDKECALLDLENKTSQKFKEVQERYSEEISEYERKCIRLEQKFSGLQKERDLLLDKISQSNKDSDILTVEIENYKHEEKKIKHLQQSLNVKLQQVCKQKNDLQSVITEQEQLLSDAERERQELATQLIARDHQVSDLQKQLSHMELASNELEAALRSQLDIATNQCAQFEAKIKDLETNTKRLEEGAQDTVVDLQRRLDSARFAHSEAVLQYTRVANENIKLQQELRRRQRETNQICQMERIKYELELRVAELETVNTELETRLASLNIAKSVYSDCESDTSGACPPLALPQPLIYMTQPCINFTSDYLSADLPSHEVQTHNLWFPRSPLSHACSSPDLGIESDQGHLSSLEVPGSAAMPVGATPTKDLIKLEEENTQLRRNLRKTRDALEETLSQLTAANQHKRQYEAQISAANQHKAKVERAICRQLHKTHSILKKARVNLAEDGRNEHH